MDASSGSAKQGRPDERIHRSIPAVLLKPNNITRGVGVKVKR